MAADRLAARASPTRGFSETSAVYLLTVMEGSLWKLTTGSLLAPGHRLEVGTAHAPGYTSGGVPLMGIARW